MTPAPASSLQIAGLTRMSTCDWPGRIVATVFLQGCPWRCTYCHNPDLIPARTPGTVEWAEVIELLSRRHGLLDGVVFSGGEPTRQPGLAAAMREVRAAGFAVGLHTSGAYPARLGEVVRLADWVGLDLKATRSTYAAITGVGRSAQAAFASLRIVLESGVDVQVRTTVDPTVLTAADVVELSEELARLGVTDHVHQEARVEGTTAEYAAALTLIRQQEAAAR